MEEYYIDSYKTNEGVSSSYIINLIDECDYETNNLGKL